MDNQEKPSPSLAELSLDDLMLEPLEGQPEAAAPVEVQAAEPCPHAAKFQVDTRAKGNDRRQLEDRRSSVRFEEPRRSGKDRRPGKNPWAPGVDI